MFLCTECYNDDFALITCPASRGPCEVCNKTKVCMDIPHGWIDRDKFTKAPQPPATGKEHQ